MLIFRLGDGLAGPVAIHVAGLVFLEVASEPPVAR